MSAMCNCGTASQSPHEIGKFGCVRFLTTAPVLVGKHPVLDCNMWDTGDNEPITEYSLISQRGYYQHQDGQWSRWESSTNSIEG
jgi:hypothetical protein